MTTPTMTTTDAARARSASRATRRWGAWYVAEHRFRSMLAYTQTVIATGIGSPLMYLFAMGVGLASLVDANVEGNGLSVSYLVFVAPALLVMASFQAASEEFSYPIMLGFKWNPIFTGMGASPLTPGQIIDGQAIATTARLIVTSVLYFVFMLLFGAVPGPYGWLALVPAVLTGLAFGAPLMAYTATLERDSGQLAMVMRFLVLPLTLFSGTVFPLTQLPWFLQWIGWVSPLWHGTELARVFAYGHVEPVWLSVVHVAYLVLLAAIGWMLARRVAARRLNR
ncbi:lipooligosaccharide transport system permease protein [Paramicrobacterium humi]|uniref:Transport permease protein n=1 Tax=Paramicrobacterium humi TaxID=640635 RepID=A0A1H4IVX7_9MICO|nr:ABC transporter permease [Microbacterium humi]SEB37776.1 lipooligosaccharide transport system permease protein [Microbacterium humi]